MGWGAPLGFSSGKTPFEQIVTAGFGEPGWYCRFRHTPTPGYPLKGRFRTPCASATFATVEDARLYVDHPGDIAELARRFIAWATEGVDPTTKEEEPPDAEG
ncbi:hypothetical protein [Rathayibacter sp. PhB127]|uniref:hypothetical protein n=1 Tax=Rathayibacter sp. PhB127 TaxID=2485176 RepID=UPI0011CDD9CB|nr:hypothetical protein [Rathayibacter sp. PhB127]